MSAISTNYRVTRPRFWNALCLTGIGIRVLCFAVFYYLLLIDPIKVSIVGVILALDLFVFIWQIHRYSNAGAHHLQQTGQFWIVAFGYALLGLLTIPMITLWWLLYSKADTSQKTYFEPYVERVYSKPKSDRFKVTLTRDGRTMFFTGVMANGMSARLEPMLDQAFALETLNLDSPGGDLIEARSLARRIQRKGINTHVTSDCSASCLLVFAAGNKRTMGPGAQLGVHRYGLDFNQLSNNIRLSKEAIKDRGFLESRGVQDAFLEQMFTQKRDAIWYPDREEIEASGLLKR